MNPRNIDAAFSDVFKPIDVAFILAVNIDWYNVNAYGGEIATPNLDRVAYGVLQCHHFDSTSRRSPT